MKMKNFHKNKGKNAGLNTVDAKFLELDDHVLSDWRQIKLVVKL